MAPIIITPIAPPDNLVTTFPRATALVPIKPPRSIPKPDKISPQASKGAIKLADEKPFEASHPTNPSFIGSYP